MVEQEEQEQEQEEEEEEEARWLLIKTSKYFRCGLMYFGWHCSG